MKHRLVGIPSVCAALMIVACGVAGTAGSEEPNVVLVKLADPSEVAGWTTVNDPVMGGKSTARIDFGNGGLVFSGNISLENNGGFASARGPQDADIGRRATGATSIGVRALGDGKTYLLKVRAAGQPWSYIQRFATEAGVTRSYELPVENFEPVGMRLDPAPDAPPTMDPSRISEVAVYILDKQQGPFELTLNEISATT
ncbi:CIA30 family protein [Mycobacterium sp. NPDC051804]|uniref:CIA30 family protein n=1 Tax=Mycobacterium sp. NPDC051804 TaxID=3364295 RepID=UPI003796A1D4